MEFKFKFYGMGLSLCKSLFSSGSYVLVITSRKDAGSYQGSPVYHVNSMKFLCCNEAIKHLTPQEVCKHYHIVCNFIHIAWSQLSTDCIYLVLGCCIYVFYLYLLAEKGWGILHVSPENCRNYLWIVLFIRQGFDTKVSALSCMYPNKATERYRLFRKGQQPLCSDCAHP